MRKLIVVVIATLVASVTAVAAIATPRGPNGQITFARFNPSVGDTQVWVVNPDGTDEHVVQASTDAGECPTWSPDGTRISTCGDFAGGGVTRLINPDTGTYSVVPSPDSSLFLPCWMWIAGGSRLLCETFSDDGSGNGLTSVRASDGGGLTRITSNPGGDDLPGDASPDGKHVVFVRYDGNFNEVGMFVLDTATGQLKRILPAGMNLSSGGKLVPERQRHRVLTARDRRRAQLDLDRPRERQRPARGQRLAGELLRRAQCRRIGTRLLLARLVTRRNEDPVRQRGWRFERLPLHGQSRRLGLDAGHTRKRRRRKPRLGHPSADRLNREPDGGRGLLTAASVVRVIRVRRLPALRLRTHRDVTRHRRDAIHPGSHRRERSQVELALLAAVRVGVQGDVRESRHVTDEPRAIGQVLVHHGQPLVAALPEPRQTLLVFLARKPAVSD